MAARARAEQARFRCGYCLTTEAIIGAAMELDHLIPESLAGPTAEENLWLACSWCNDYKSNLLVAADPETGEIVRLFNPRTQSWREHFSWTPEGDRIIGRTPTGRATVLALRLNRDHVVRSRQLWVKAGWHPPQD